MILADLWVIVERTTSQGSCSAPSSSSSSSAADAGLQLYVHPVTFSVVPPSDTTEGAGQRRLSSTHSSAGDVSVDDGSFLIGKDESDVLFFRVINKNAVMADPRCRLKFTCATMVHPDLQTLSACCPGEGVDQENEGPGKIGDQEVEGSNIVMGGREIKGPLQPLQVAIIFGGAAFKWYGMVQNGCTYLLTLHSHASDVPLPSWEVLRTNRTLSITDDMVPQLVSGRGGRGKDVLDVSDLAKQLLLPPLKTLCPFQETSTKQRCV